MSEAQFQGEITLIANHLFWGKEYRDWEVYEQGKECDCNTLPVPTNINRNEPYLDDDDDDDELFLWYDWPAKYV